MGHVGPGVQSRCVFGALVTRLLAQVPIDTDASIESRVADSIREGTVANTHRVVASCIRSAARLLGSARVEDYETYDMDDELINGTTGGKLPAVYLNVTYDCTNADRPDLGDASAFVLEFRLIALLTFPEDPTD
jgi:hypothetical protein